MEDFFKSLVALKEDKVFDHSSDVRVKFQKFNKFRRGAPATLEEPFIMILDERAVFLLFHCWQEYCRIAVVMRNLRGKGFV